MPFIDVKILDSRLAGGGERALIEKIAQAVVDVYGEQIRPHIWTVVTGVPAERWGIGGHPSIQRDPSIPKDPSDSRASA
jgi:4-oxalocrotonate tautomerase